MISEFSKGSFFNDLLIGCEEIIHRTQKPSWKVDYNSIKELENNIGVCLGFLKETRRFIGNRSIDLGKLGKKKTSSNKEARCETEVLFNIFRKRMNTIRFLR